MPSDLRGIVLCQPHFRNDCRVEGIFRLVSLLSFPRLRAGITSTYITCRICSTLFPGQPKPDRPCGTSSAKRRLLLRWQRKRPTLRHRPFPLLSTMHHRNWCTEASPLYNASQWLADATTRSANFNSFVTSFARHAVPQNILRKA